jgi:hypothetical protein
VIVPQFWAEASARHRDAKRQLTLRRFGWSDQSQADAQAHAEARVAEAMQRALGGETLPRREPKVGYNGAKGVPIREEIVDRAGQAVITRNSYGARCLNTPNVLFADIDFPVKPPLRWTLLVMAGLLPLALWGGRWLGGKGWTIAFMLLALFISSTIAKQLFTGRLGAAGGAEQQARRRAQAYARAHPDAGLRLYRTPAGMRVLLTHRPFDPEEPAVDECFKALRVDPLYARMCRQQRCFRARVSAKPWRIGIGQHMRPRPGVWPVAPERLPVRQAWVQAYEARAQGFAACRWVESLGRDAVHADVAPVLEWHDALCHAQQDMPLA